MINGLEDMYEWKTGTRLPDYLLFLLGGMSGFSYIQNKNANPPKMVLWGPQMKLMYEFLSDVIGYAWKYIENRSFNFTLGKAKECIDRSFPVILGALDMFHLTYYEKFYHRTHIPIHYVLMIGYDDNEQIAFINDCGKKETQKVSYNDLEKAMNVHVPGISLKNTIHGFKFNKDISDLKRIVFKGLKKKADYNLNPPVRFLGLPGIKKLSEEFPDWLEKLTKPQLKKCLMHFVEYTGSVIPMLPSRLVHFNIDKQFEVHMGNRDKFTTLLKSLSSEFKKPEWIHAANHFKESGIIIEKITSGITDHLLDSSSVLGNIPNELLKISQLEEKAYQSILSSLEEE
jgi:hypothetical protein